MGRLGNLQKVNTVRISKIRAERQSGHSIKYFVWTKKNKREIKTDSEVHRACRMTESGGKRDDLEVN